MNTPSHAILNLTFLGHTAYPRSNLLIVIGAIVPDLPIFLFYAWAKLIVQLPENIIWTEAYYSPWVQDIVAVCHSIPLALLGWLIGFCFKWSGLQLFCLSLVFHSLLDLPVHHDDAHRHFFPLSNYRLISPISYWDPRHYGGIVAFLEMVFVLLATVRNFETVQSPIGRGAMVGVNLFYGLGYYLLYSSNNSTHF
ncbi:MAG: hypothetical protein HC920_20450 [Oscillatoriales cyanobacterium SM2_3_0]|nr:hypothetical protein [Oscillatoriales cyanobacterium SM2_3_0]